MNIYRAGDPQSRKPVLKPIAPVARKRPAEIPDSAEAREQGRSSQPIQPLSSTTTTRATPTAPVVHQPVSGPGNPPLTERLLGLLPNMPAEQVRNAARKTVSVPIWLAAVLVLAIVAAPILSVWLMRNSSEPVIELVEVAVEPEPTEEQQSLEELYLALEAESLVGATEWSRPDPTPVSNREQYLLDGGVSPDLEIRYAADEVARLQAELEAIQRNSALLRSLARQQSGDLTTAYSTLELTQEQAEDVLADLQGRIDDLEGRIQSVDELARELRDILGLQQSTNGVGGPKPFSATEDADPWLVLRSDIVSIEHWAGELVFDLDEINTEIQLRMAMVNQTGLPRGTSLGDDLEFFDSMPVGWPVEGPITSRFGVRSSPFSAEGTPEMHTGIDIAARTGTPVIATGGGTVQLAGDNGGYGLLVVIDHGRGVTSWYGHNSRLLVTPGQRVNAGDVIAEVGSTGRSTGPHVHYEVRVNGVPEDPLPYMQMER